MAGQQPEDQLGRSVVKRKRWVGAVVGEVGFGHERPFGCKPNEGLLPLPALWSVRARPSVRVVASPAKRRSVSRAQDLDLDQPGVEEGHARCENTAKRADSARGLSPPHATSIRRRSHPQKNQQSKAVVPPESPKEICSYAFGAAWPGSSARTSAMAAVNPKRAPKVVNRRAVRKARRRIRACLYRQWSIPRP